MIDSYILSDSAGHIGGTCVNDKCYGRFVLCNTSANLCFCHGRCEPVTVCKRKGEITLNAPISTKVVCFSRLLKCLRSLCGKQCGPRSDCSYTAPIGAVCSGSTLFASILNLSVMLGSYLHQTTSADDIFR